MDFLRKSNIFVHVVDKGSFAKAADHLKINRPAVTNAINELEQDFGVKLFQRTTRKVTLTNEGEQALEKILTILHNVHEVKKLFNSQSHKPSGKLRVDIPIALAKTIIIPNLSDFIDQYPDIDIILGVSDQPVNLINDGVDCVLRIGQLPDSSLITQVIGKITMVICAAPSYLKRYGTPQLFHDLSKHVAINYVSSRGYRPIPWQLSDNNNSFTTRLKSSLTVNDTETFIASAIAGIGLIQVPRICVQDYLNTEELIEVLPQKPVIQRPLSIIYPDKNFITPQVNVFIQWIKSLIKQHKL